MSDVKPVDTEEVLARVAAGEIVTTGVLLYSSDEKPILYPFSADRTYGFVLDIQVSKEQVETFSQMRAEEGKGVVITITRSFASSGASIHYNLLVAVNEKYTYYLNLSVNIIGPIEKFWFDVHYNVLRRPLP